MAGDDSAFLTDLKVGAFSFVRCVGAIQLASGTLSEGTAPYVAIYSMCLWEEGTSGASQASILVDPQFQLIKFSPFLTPDCRKDHKSLASPVGPEGLDAADCWWLCLSNSWTIRGTGAVIAGWFLPSGLHRWGCKGFGVNNFLYQEISIFVP